MPGSWYYLMVISTIVFFCSFCVRSSMAGNNDTDKLALLEIKGKIDDPFGAMDSWNDSVHFCNWYGVTCSRSTLQRVTSLSLQSSGISGFLSPFIGNLTFLREIQLQNNSFTGIIPPEIGLLHRLHHLWIYNNSFVGEIPSNISGCSNLVKFSAGFNNLVGSIPSEIGSLLQLQFLSLGRNNLTGNLPASLGNLSSLSVISAAFNNFVGSIPSSFGKLKRLTFLGLEQNQLSGLFPNSLFNLSSLTVLDVGENGLEGKLPSDIGVTLPLLTDLTIANNRFSGVIPISLSNLSGLSILQLTSNNLRGKVPSFKNSVNLTIFNIGDNLLGNGLNQNQGLTDELGFVASLENATELFLLDIHQNNFVGVFPNIVCNFSALTFLVLHTNEITGEIPSCIGDLAGLQFFSIMINQISGIIPRSIGKLQELNTLTLYNNQLSGHIPSSVGNLTNLNFLNVGGNNLSGEIPSSIGNCTNMIGMDLSRNNLEGKIPSEIFSLSALSLALYLYDNNLTGHLDPNIGLLKNLVDFRISNNKLSGEIPASLSSCVELEFLYLGVNSFQEAIPDALQTLRSLQELDLSQNNLSGTIPGFLASLPLRYLNLTYNNFTGQVPSGGVFSNRTGISTLGNDMLCGGIAELNLPKCTFHKSLGMKSDRRKNLTKALIFGFLGIIIIVTFTSLCTFWYQKRLRKPATTEIEAGSLSYVNLSYQSLLKATDGFSAENLIGRGGFGTVYKGILDPEKPLVAIKVFNLENHGAFKSFLAECGVLRNIRHRNLVKVITACSSIDYCAKDFKALVYEYMVNGSLEDWLHDDLHRVTRHQSLNFRHRLDIAVDVASALEYLHYGCGASIVHCDLKPSNILLDEDMVARVSDFGLAKFLGSSQSSCSSSLGVRGTVGYAPPEYGLGNEVSTSGDVYSFGILLMEMVTGKRPTVGIFKDGLNLRKFVQAEKVTDILDETLVDDQIKDDPENGKSMLKAVISVLGVALSCSAELPHERLDMKDVTSELSSIRNSFLSSISESE